MAARNPTSLTKWQNIARIETGKSILASTVDDVINDQIFTLDEEQMVASWRATSPAGTYYTASATFAEMSVLAGTATFMIKSKDNCLSSGNLSHEGAVLAACDVGTTGEIVFYNATIPSTSGALAVTATSLTWHGWATFNFPSYDTIDSIQIQGKVTSGGGNIYLGGFCIFALET